MNNKKNISKYSEWIKVNFLLLSMWQLLPKWYDLRVHPMFHLVFNNNQTLPWLYFWVLFCLFVPRVDWSHCPCPGLSLSLCCGTVVYKSEERIFFTLKSYLLSILWICNFEMHFSHLTAASAKCANLLIRLLYRGGDRKLVHPCFHQNINNIALLKPEGNIIIYGVRPQQKREVS